MAKKKKDPLAGIQALQYIPAPAVRLESSPIVTIGAPYEYDSSQLPSKKVQRDAYNYSQLLQGTNTDYHTGHTTTLGTLTSDSLLEDVTVNLAIQDSIASGNYGQNRIDIIRNGTTIYTKSVLLKNTQGGYSNLSANPHLVLRAGDVINMVTTVHVGVGVSFAAFGAVSLQIFR